MHNKNKYITGSGLISIQIKWLYMYYMYDVKPQQAVEFYSGFVYTFVSGD